MEAHEGTGVMKVSGMFPADCHESSARSGYPSCRGSVCVFRTERLQIAPALGESENDDVTGVVLPN